MEFSHNEKLLAELIKMGPLPDDCSEADDDFPYDEFDLLLQQFETPISFSEAVALIKLSPPAGTGARGVEWALLRLVETLTPLADLKLVVDAAEDCELKMLISQRIANS